MKNAINLIFYGRIIGVTCISGILLIGGLLKQNSEAMTIGFFGIMLAVTAFLLGKE